MRTAVSLTREFDRTLCDTEPIHIPESIQPHGLLMVLEGPDLTVRRVSCNIEERLGLEVEAVVGRPLVDVLGGEVVDRLRDGLESAPHEAFPVLLGTVMAHEKRLFQAVAHRSGGLVLLELEPADAMEAEPFYVVYPPLQAFLSKLAAVADVEALIKLAAVEIRRITRFDRVLIYRFDEDDHGTVLAEERNDRLPSLDGHRFPGSDIPRQARALYVKNRIRLIPDASYTPVPLSPDVGVPLDMTFSTLRSVSPIHLEYLRNMGTMASMSISIVREGRLWGLIACHHSSPRVVTSDIRIACEFFAQVFTLHLANKEHQQEYERRLALSGAQARLVASLTAGNDFVKTLAEHADDLLTYADARGAAVIFDGHCTRWGESPPEAEIRRLADWLASDIRREVFATESLVSLQPWAESIRDRASGLLAVSISKLYNNHLIWFRPEQIRTLVWAGDRTSGESRWAGRRPSAVVRVVEGDRQAPLDPLAQERARRRRRAP